VLESSDKHKIKNIRVMPGKRLSLQLHKHRSEHWVVFKGRACVEVDGEQMCLGEYVCEGDIVRFDDEYGRV
jgi:mannose-1-phosphate guanylyltransferase/mannose-6-phosphate isomerase